MSKKSFRKKYKKIQIKKTFQKIKEITANEKKYFLEFKKKHNT
jgi:hypothetical protein